MILDLCSGTGAWSKPYRDAGIEVKQIDIDRNFDVRLIEKTYKNVTGILCAPPCTHLAGSGARWWKEKGESALLDALSIVDACLRAVVIYQPKWWCLENPVGRLVHYLGRPKMYFHPYEYAGWADDWTKEAYTKKTCLWGNFNTPEKKPVDPIIKGYIHHLPPSVYRSRLRSITPSGFARAFFEANHSLATSAKKDEI